MCTDHDSLAQGSGELVTDEGWVSPISRKEVFKETLGRVRPFDSLLFAHQKL